MAPVHRVVPLRGLPSLLHLWIQAPPPWIVANQGVTVALDEFETRYCHERPMKMSTPHRVDNPDPAAETAPPPDLHTALVDLSKRSADRHITRVVTNPRLGTVACVLADLSADEVYRIGDILRDAQRRLVR